MFDFFVEKIVVELCQLIGSKQVFLVELLDVCIVCIEDFNFYINVVIVICFECVCKEVCVVEQVVMDGVELGLLYGLFIGIKDLEEIEGLLIIYGLFIYCGNVFVYDNVLVVCLCVVGVIVVGKINVFEMGVGVNSCNMVWGVIGNFFNLLFNVGGFFGGLVVVLVVDLLLLCLGLDIGGLLCILVVKCGVVGFCFLLGLVLSECKLLGWMLILVVGLMGCNVVDIVL